MSACSWMSSEASRAWVRSLTSTPCMLPLREWEGALIVVMEADRCLFTCDRVPAHAGATEGEGQRGRGRGGGAEGRGRAYC